MKPSTAQIKDKRVMVVIKASLDWLISLQRYGRKIKIQPLLLH
jgi:hypothetical protein